MTEYYKQCIYNNVCRWNMCDGVGCPAFEQIYKIDNDRDETCKHCDVCNEDVCGYLACKAYEQRPLKGKPNDRDETCKHATNCDIGYCMAGACQAYEAIERGDMSVDPKSTYYDVGNLETIDIIKSKINDVSGGFAAYCLGNAIKYLCRCAYKGSMKRDLEKAIVYIKMIIDDDE